MIRRAAPVAAACSALLLAVGVVAQEQKEKKASGHERLQPYWTALDLTETQRTAYDKVVRKYKPKLEELEDQIEKLKEGRRKEWHAILTPAQAQKLEAALAAKGKNKKGDDDEPKSTTKRKPKDDDADEKDVKKSPKSSDDEPEKKPAKKPTTKKPSKTKPADDK